MFLFEIVYYIDNALYHYRTDYSIIISEQIEVCLRSRFDCDENHCKLTVFLKLFLLGRKQVSSLVS